MKTFEERFDTFLRNEENYEWGKYGTALRPTNVEQFVLLEKALSAREAREEILKKSSKILRGMLRDFVLTQPPTESVTKRGYVSKEEFERIFDGLLRDSLETDNR